MNSPAADPSRRRRRWWIVMALATLALAAAVLPLPRIERISWDTSRAEWLGETIVRHGWAVALAVLAAAALLALARLARRVSRGNLATAGFFLLALGAHLLLGAGSFFVYLKGDAIQAAGRRLTELVVATRFVESLPLPREFSRPAHEQIGDLRPLEPITVPGVDRDASASAVDPVLATLAPSAAALRPMPGGTLALLVPEDRPERLAIAPAVERNAVQFASPPVAAQVEKRDARLPPVVPPMLGLPAAPLPVRPLPVLPAADADNAVALLAPPPVPERTPAFVPPPAPVEAARTTHEPIRVSLPAALVPALPSPRDPAALRDPARLATAPAGPELVAPAATGPPAAAAEQSAVVSVDIPAVPRGRPLPPAPTIVSPPAPPGAHNRRDPVAWAVVARAEPVTPPGAASPAAHDDVMRPVELTLERPAPKAAAVGAAPSLIAQIAPDGTPDGSRAAALAAQLAPGEMKLALLVATPVRDAPQADRRSLGLRADGAKSELVGSLGGSAAALESVRLGLEWLARHQADDGRWSLNRYHKLAPGEPNSGAGSIDCDSAATGLAILPFLADGHTHRDGAHRATVERGLNWLLKLQRETGELTSDEKSRVRMYGHGIATIALCEAYGMTGDAALRGPCERAIRFIVEAQDPKSGGWRYQPREPGDTSVVGWQVMALKSGQIAGLEVPAETWEQTRKFLASVEGKNASVGTFGYQNSNATPAMTAEALLCLEYLDARRDDPRLEAGTRYLLKNLPQPGRESSYYWYYATQALFHRQGPEWLAWNNALVPLLTDSQIKTGPHSGSWAPSDQWEYQGGRLYATALRLMMLEVYYRYLPLYRPL